MRLTPRQREVLRSYAEAERLALPMPREVERIARLDGHAYGMAVWGLSRVLCALEAKGAIGPGSRVTDAGRHEVQEMSEHDPVSCPDCGAQWISAQREIIRLRDALFVAEGAAKDAALDRQQATAWLEEIGHALGVTLREIAHDTHGVVRDRAIVLRRERDAAQAESERLRAELDDAGEGMAARLRASLDACCGQTPESSLERQEDCPCDGCTEERAALYLWEEVTT